MSRRDYRTDEGYDWDAWKKDIKSGAKKLKEDRERIKEEKKKISREERERKKKVAKLWIDLLYYGLMVALKFVPLGSVANLVLTLLKIIRFNRK